MLIEFLFIQATFQESWHSAEVDIALIVAGKFLPIAQLGPDFAILRESVQLEAGMAEVFLRIDGEDERWPVRLREGAVPDATRVAIQQL